MAGPQSLMQRWENYRVSKTATFWFGASCAIATMVVGFAWGGWELGGKVNAAKAEAVAIARAELASVLCVERFARGPDATVKLASLKSVDSWKRDTFIQDGGWVTVAGIEAPIAGAAALCARQLMENGLPAVPVRKLD
jgi:hypothetical protein